MYYAQTFGILILVNEPSTEQSKDLERQQLLKSIEQKEEQRSRGGRFLETQITSPEPLHTSISQTPGLWGYNNAVIIGNTGLFFINDDGMVFEHFLPNGSSIPQTGSEMRFTGALCAGFSEFINWYKDPQNRTFGGSKEITTIYGITNQQLSEVAKKILGSHCEVIGKYEGDFGPEDIGALKMESLLQDHKTINRIRLIGDRALKSGFQMQSIPFNRSDVSRAA